MSTHNEKTIDNRDPEVIRREIHKTTAELTETLDAIQDKFAPDALVAEAREKALDVAEGVRDRVITGARRHPLAASLVGLGLAWLVGRQFSTRAQGRGSGLVSFALGAAIAVSVYRAIVKERYIDDDEPILEILTGEYTADGEFTPPALPNRGARA